MKLFVPLLIGAVLAQNTPNSQPPHEPLGEEVKEYKLPDSEPEKKVSDDTPKKEDK
jgi:hypothetical protein